MIPSVCSWNKTSSSLINLILHFKPLCWLPHLPLPCDKVNSLMWQKGKRAGGKEKVGREKTLERPWKDQKERRTMREVFGGYASNYVCVCMCVCVGFKGFTGQPLTYHWLISRNSEQNAGCDLTAAWALGPAFMSNKAALFPYGCIFSLFILLPF